MHERDQDDQQLSTRIKNYLTKDNNFRNPSFDPAPYLIKVMKQRQANHQLLVKKQMQLIQLENQAQELIEQAIGQRTQQFFSILSLPQAVGMQLQGLKSSTASVKKKVRQTKGLLLATQKDLQQIHLNCLFNKLIYGRLKQIQLKLSQYQSASLALKNHLYLDCAINLPNFNNNSPLHQALNIRVQNLKLRYLAQVIQQLRIFLFFTPRLTAMNTYSFLDRTQQRIDPLIDPLHANFIKRCQLFKKAKCQEYLNAIWSIKDLEQRSGKVAVVQDIIKGVIRIGKVSQVTQSLTIDLKKSVSNIFKVLYYFLAKNVVQNSKNQQKKWFTSSIYDQHLSSLSTLLCVGAAMIRKAIIFRKICFQYQLQELCENFKIQQLLLMLTTQAYGFIQSVFFPQTDEQVYVNQDPIIKLRSKANQTHYPFLKKLLQKSIIILCQKLSQVQKQLFLGTNMLKIQKYLLFNQFDKSFQTLFHSKFIQTIQQILPQGRGFINEYIQNIFSTKKYNQFQIHFCSNYASQDRKSIKQFVNIISFAQSLKIYFTQNQYDPNILSIYFSYLLSMFYFKFNLTLFQTLINHKNHEKIQEARAKDLKYKAKQKSQITKYSKLAIYQNKKQKKMKKNEQENTPIRSAQQLRMVRSQLQMLLNYCLENYPVRPQYLTSQLASTMQQQIQKFQPSNYQSGFHSKLIRIWQQLIKPLQNGSMLIVALYRKLVDLYITTLGNLYIQTGSF